MGRAGSLDKMTGAELVYSGMRLGRPGSRGWDAALMAMRGGYAAFRAGRRSRRDLRYGRDCFAPRVSIMMLFNISQAFSVCFSSAIGMLPAKRPVE